MVPPLPSKKRKVLDGMNGKITRPKKKIKKQLEYHSSSDEEEETIADKADFAPVNLLESDAEDGNSTGVKKESQKSGNDLATSKKPSKQKQQQQQKEEKEDDSDDDRDTNASKDDSDSDDDGDESGSDASSEDDSSGDESSNEGNNKNQRRVPKRNDPTAFSTSISKILNTRLPTSARADPVLSRSKAAAQTTSELANEKLEQQARAKLRAEKQEMLERGHIRDVMGVERGIAGETAEEEKRLRKIAQRGVVKLFNAVRAAQVRGEQAAKEERQKGTIGMEERKKAVNEVSKQGFLELINSKKGKPVTIEEA